MANTNTLRHSGLSAVNRSSSPTSRELPTDPLGILGAITRLIEQGLIPADIENLPDSNQEVLESSRGTGAVEPVETERTPPGNEDTSTLGSNLDELEGAIERHEQQVEVRNLSLKEGLGIYYAMFTIES